MCAEGPLSGSRGARGRPGRQQQLRHYYDLAQRDGGRKRLEKGQSGRRQPSAAAPAEVSALGRPDAYRLPRPVRQLRTQPAASPAST